MTCQIERKKKEHKNQETKQRQMLDTTSAKLIFARKPIPDRAGGLSITAEHVSTHLLGPAPGQKDALETCTGKEYMVMRGLDYAAFCLGRLMPV